MSERHRDVVIRRIVAASRVGRELPDLAKVAQEIGQGLGVRACSVAVADAVAGGGGDHSEPDTGQWFTWTAEPSGAGPVGQRIREIRFSGDLVGWLALPDPLLASGSRRRLLQDIVLVLGPVLDAARLSIAMHRELSAAIAHADAIAAARRRTLAEMDDQRRLLERNLHDGAQHRMVHLRLMIGLLEHQLAAGDEMAVAAQLQALDEQITETAAVVRDTAGGILPVSLVVGGLGPALQAEIGHDAGITLELPVELQGRYTRAAETAVFYACLEAVTNARKHAPGAAITVTLRHMYHGLWFAVRDDGPGFDPATLPAGSGLGRLSDRVSAVGGTVIVRSAPGQGTVLEGMVPI